MGTFRGLPPEVLESLGLDPEGDEDEPDEPDEPAGPAGPYELPHRIAETSPRKGVAGPGDDRPGGPASLRCRGESPIRSAAAIRPERFAGRGALHVPARARIREMKESPMKVTLTEPGVAGDYIVAERHADGTVVLAPDTSIEAIRKRLGTRAMSPDEFEQRFGQLPSDPEG